MIKKILLILILFGLSISITKADTEHTLGALQSFFKGIAYVGTFFSWLVIFYIISKNNRKFIIVNLINAVVCGWIGMEAIKSGNYLSGYASQSESAESYITWGWIIIIINVLPLLIAVVGIAIKDGLNPNEIT